MRRGVSGVEVGSRGNGVGLRCLECGEGSSRGLGNAKLLAFGFWSLCSLRQGLSVHW